jgi:hypothetical protein
MFRHAVRTKTFEARLRPTLDRPVNLPTLDPARSPLAATQSGRGATPGRFAQVLQAQQQAPSAQTTRSPHNQTRVVRSGDTLVGLVKAHYAEQGQTVSEGQAYREALQIAQANGIRNPNLIHPNQLVRMNLGPQAVARASNSDQPPNTAPAVSRSTPSIEPAATRQSGEHVLLNKTLQRAVDKGYMASHQAPEVARKVLALSDKYKFQPDDFARMTLMESGGMNPKASNGHCHGIIQFCSGNSRGAAAVGLRDNPRAILGMGLLQQLDLVDTYFNHVGLAQGKQSVSLDELYLSILTPAAREETRPNAPLAIPGPQARDLHVGGNRQGPITRNSIVQGLHALSERIFGSVSGAQRKAHAYATLMSPDSGS